SLDGGIGLSNLRLIVIVLKLNQELSLVYLLVIGDSYVADNAGNFGTEWCEVAANIGVIGDLVNLTALPGIPVSSNGNNDSDSEQHYQYGSQVLYPLGATLGCILPCVWRRLGGRCRLRR